MHKLSLIGPAVLLAVLLTGHSNSGGTAPASGATAPAVLMSQASALDAQGAKLQAAAETYGVAVTALHSAAAENKRALKLWTTYSERLAEWSKVAKAVDDHNAAEAAKAAANPGHTETSSHWDSWSATMVTTTRHVPGYSPQYLSKPAKPSEPARVKVDLKRVTAALVKAKAGLTSVTGFLAKQHIAPELAAVGTSVGHATQFALKRVKAALVAVPAMVKDDSTRGQAIDQAAANTISTAGIGDAIDAARNALISARAKGLASVLTRKQLDSLVLKWAVPAGQSSSPLPNASAGLRTVALSPVTTSPGVIVVVWFRIDAPTNGRAQAHVAIKAPQGNVVATYATTSDKLGEITNQRRRASFRCTLPAGQYTWLVYAEDAAGHKQVAATPAAFVVQ